MMFKHLMLKVEVQAGTTIEQAAKDMINLSRKMNMAVTTSFNGTPIMATPHREPEDVVEDFHRFHKSGYSDNRVEMRS